MKKPILAIALVSLIPTALQAQQVVQSQGSDSRVDYASLTQFGPWDDRNYQLTAEDLELLAPNEEEQIVAIPAFFRVEMRRANPNLRREGPGQYPRSALNVFRQMFGGYLVNGVLYQGLRRLESGEYEVIEEKGVDLEVFEEGGTRFLEGEVRVSSPVGAAESAIKIHPTNTDIVIAGSNGPGSGQIMHYSSDGGETWNESAALPLGSTCCDPTVDWKSDGSLAHTATLGSCGFGGCNIWTYRSSDNGQSWDDLSSVTPGDPRRELTSSGISDKEFIHVDKYSGSTHQDNVYLTWHDNNVMQFSRSTNDGVTWATPTSFSSDPSGIGSDIATDKSGNVYYFWPTLSGSDPEVVMKKSTNGGASFPSGVTTVADLNDAFDFAIPAMDTRLAFIYVAADVDLSDGPFGDSIYTAWTDTNGPESGTAANNHARIQVGYSRDGGATWNIVTPHETSDILTVDRFHPWLSVAPDGSVHVVFYDTREGVRSSTDLFYSFSTDGAQTFSDPQRVTTVTSPKIDDSFEWGDYNGLDAVMTELIAIYTDNRNEGGGGADSVDIYAIGRVLENSDVFADGFETGDTSRWDGVVP